MNPFQYKAPRLSKRRKVATKFLLPAKRPPRTPVTISPLSHDTSTKQATWVPNMIQDSDSDDYSDDENIYENRYEGISSSTNNPETGLQNIAPSHINLPVIDGLAVSHGTSRAASPRAASDGSTYDPLQSFNQSRILRKGDRVTFFNEISFKWIVVTLTSNQIKYCKKQAPITILSL